MPKMNIDERDYMNVKTLAYARDLHSAFAGRRVSFVEAAEAHEALPGIRPPCPTKLVDTAAYLDSLVAAKEYPFQEVGECRG